MSDQQPRATNRPSDEASAPQLALARQQGEAFAAALRAMSEMDEHGRVKRVADYLIGWETEEAEGMWMPEAGGGLRWQDPEQENAHLEVVVRDADDGRFLPALRIHARLVGPDGTEVGAFDLPFLWHPWLFHYGRNIQVPGEGSYRLHLRIDPPDFPRHDKTNGKRYAEPVEVWFDDVRIETGRKLS